MVQGPARQQLAFPQYENQLLHASFAADHRAYHRWQHIPERPERMRSGYQRPIRLLPNIVYSSCYTPDLPKPNFPLAGQSAGNIPGTIITRVSLEFTVAFPRANALTCPGSPIYFYVSIRFSREVTW